MCEKAPISDPQICELCKSMVAGQQDEISQMKAMLKALARQSPDGPFQATPKRPTPA